MTFLLLFLATACLSLAMVRHQRDLFAATLPRWQARLLRWLGSALLLLSIAIGPWDEVFPVRWLGEFSLAILLTVAIVSACRRASRK